VSAATGDPSAQLSAALHPVQDALDDAYYAPIRRRSWGGTNREWLRNKTAPTLRMPYADWWNGAVLLSIQVESVETVRNISQLVQPGITYVTRGLNDLELPCKSIATPSSTRSKLAGSMCAEQLDGIGIRISMGPAVLRPRHSRAVSPRR